MPPNSSRSSNVSIYITTAPRYIIFLSAEVGRACALTKATVCDKKKTVCSKKTVRVPLSGGPKKTGAVCVNENPCALRDMWIATVCLKEQRQSNKTGLHGSWTPGSGSGPKIKGFLLNNN